MTTRRNAIRKLAGCMAAASVTPLLSVSSLEEMNTREIPSSKEKLPIIGMGTWQTFDVATTESELRPLRDVLKVFYDGGGRLIDSSPMYGNSESVTGKLSQEAGLAKNLFLATKVWTTGEANGVTQMQKSARLLQKPVLDLMQVHNLQDYATHYKTLRRWKAEGKVRYIGITHYTTGAYNELAAVIKNDAVDFVQFNYSIGVTEAEKYLLPLAADKGVAVIINRPFEGGSLFARTKGKELPAWASEVQCQSWSQFFLKYILAHPAVTCVIPATSKAKHMEDNLRAGYGRLPTKEESRKMKILYDSV